MNTETTNNIIDDYIIETMKEEISKASTLEFRIFRSTIDRKLFAVHQVDFDENSKCEMLDGLTFDEAKEALEDYKKISMVMYPSDESKL